MICKVICNNVTYHLTDVYLFGKIEKGGRGGYLLKGERGEFTTRENMVISMSCNPSDLKSPTQKLRRVHPFQSCSL